MDTKIIKKQKIFSQIIKRDLAMACYTPPLNKAKKQGEMPLPILSPIPFTNVECRDGMRVRMGNGISPCFFAFLRSGI